MESNKNFNIYIPDELKLYSSSTNISREISSTEKGDSENLIRENTTTAITSDPSLILAPFILLVMGGTVILHKIKLSRQTYDIKNSNDFPCQNCHFFSKNSYLKCAVNPSLVFTKAAINCCDYQPL
ncbi:MAG: hypothetical protein RM022_016670 [Nostoc sp. EfeVER01]|uniref:hypothetical protein n=1 Tax=unclassified Nostoc TaxID=2593658 RepID=UPI002AD368DD|nr:MULTISPECIES: hypothetical protein [unclassified Nostoc]MDZ7944910.1 hypothetical protein [Nostoc sp. EfeVER01]MDZ7992558.1 hypothetical protein [Nostoc sp. EspVER01]